MLGYALVLHLDHQFTFTTYTERHLQKLKPHLHTLPGGRRTVDALSDAKTESEGKTSNTNVGSESKHFNFP